MGLESSVKGSVFADSELGFFFWLGDCASAGTSARSVLGALGVPASGVCRV